MKSQESKIQSQSPIKLGLLLLGSFVLAYLAAESLHELCHTLAAILTGGHSSGIVIDPFNWSYSQSSSIRHPVIHTAAGALGSSFIALLLFILLIRWPKPVFLPLLLVGPIALLNNGHYWAADIIFGMGYDAYRLSQNGISAWLLLLAGIVQCLIGIILAIYLMRVIGLTNERFKNRLIVFAIGIIPYALAGVFWNWYSGIEIMWFSAFGFAAFFVIITGFFKTQKSIQYDIKWPSAAGYTLLGIGLVIALSAMAASGKSTNSSSLFQIVTTRPENCPDVLVPHRLAFNISYMIPPPKKSQKPYLLNYSLPEDADPNEVRNDLTKLIKDKGYIQLHYQLGNPKKPLNGTWREDTDKIGFKTIQGKSYRQEWIRLTPKVGYLTVHVAYLWREKTLQTANVFMIASDILEIDEVLLYVDVHPEGFDWFEIEQLRMKTIFEKKYPESVVRMK